MGGKMLNANSTLPSAEQTEEPSPITSLRLRDKRVRPEDLATIATNYPMLDELNLFNCGLSANHIKSLVDLTALTSLTSLSLEGNNIDVDGARMLTALTALTTLDVSCNTIGDVGAQALVVLTRLTSLNLNRNTIGPAGARSLAALTGLISLQLVGNKIGNDGAQALLQHPRLAEIYCYANNIDDSLEKVLKEHVKRIRLRILEILILLTRAQQTQGNVWFGMPIDVMLIILSYFKKIDIAQYKLTPERLITIYQRINTYCQKNPSNEIVYPFSRLPRLLKQLNPAQTTNAPMTDSPIVQHGMFGDRTDPGILAITHHTTGVHSVATAPNQATPAHDVRITTGIATLQLQCDDYINNNAEALKTESTISTPEQQSTHARAYESGCEMIKSQCKVWLTQYCGHPLTLAFQK
jgi:hypothetical protein